MNQLLKELYKLQQLAPRPIDLSFLIGYLAYSLTPEDIPNFRPSLKKLILYRDQSFITSDNILELLVILKHKVLKSDPKKLPSSIQYYAEELLGNNKYLYSCYFEEKVQVQKEKAGLGIECSICAVQLDAKSISYLSCDHMYHRECFIEYSKEQIAKKSIPLKCPTEDCRLELTNQEISQFLPKDLKLKYDDFMFDNYVEKHMDDTSWCPTPGCKAVFAFDEQLDNYRCPSCSKHYCLRCKCQMHVGITCKEYQEIGEMSEPDKKFMVLVKGSKYKQCPNCKFWVQKNQGCDHMTCRCKYQFCYICGGKYGACSCVGAPRNALLRPMPIPRPMPMPIHRPMPIPNRPPYHEVSNPRPQHRPYLIPHRRPSYQQQEFLSDEDIIPPQLYNSVSEEQRRQEQQFNRILKKIAEEEQEQKKVKQREELRLFKSQIHRPIKREEIKKQAKDKDEIKIEGKEQKQQQEEKKEPQQKKQQQKSSVKVQVPNFLKFSYNPPKPKEQQ